ncbi:MAG: S-methyl-5'-thioadenosine phosphorylase [Chloroflexi bacterium]|nr:S-methyl-5'-thioadenosine phosphorylase [Chloroflexota bacterium]
MAEAQIGIIGGSGLYDMEALTDREEVRPETPFGEPSDAIVLGTLEGTRVAFLPRHGKGHRLNPTSIPVRANIFALKTLGVTHVVSISAVGSLREEIRPLDMVVPDQLIDRTKSRVNSFFEEELVVHAAFADPYCPALSQALYDVASSVTERAHKGGTLIVMEGPLFSTRAESEMYRSWGASIIGMTALPEAKLAREAELCYATLACATDYDCWRPGYDSVSVELIVGNLIKNVGAAQQIIRNLMGLIPDRRGCDCQNALRDAIITSRERIPDRLKDELRPLIGKYIS